MNLSLFTRLFAALLVVCTVACTPPSPTTSATTTPEKAASATPMATTASAPAAPTVFPDPPNEQKSLEVTTAKGVQIYTCGPKKDNKEQFEWSLKAPEAELLDSKGYKVGKHYGGPTWEGTDGSKVVGDADKRQSKPAPGAIPWLLLPAKSTAGKGIFGQVKSIQRLYTEGGVAPATGCDKANVGKEVRVDYKATYYFYVAKP
ncbi:MAG TPA: DUF3455 domain-containing protein [Blastocatellia bacterium]|nr:DUF3455 domain-containing protein [Blastocatellia bacterium]